MNISINILKSKKKVLDHMLKQWPHIPVNYVQYNNVGSAVTVRHIIIIDSEARRAVDINGEGLQWRVRVFQMNLLFHVCSTMLVKKTSN